MFAVKIATVTKHRRFSMPWRCTHCGHAAIAHVAATGRGTDSISYFTDSRVAQRRASQSAEESLEDDARVLLEIARCPACRKRSADAQQYGFTTNVGVFALLVTTAFATLFAYASDAGTRLVVVPVIGALVVVVFYARRTRRFRNIDRLVTFSVEAAEDSAQRSD